jgi:hypothetical protein
MRYSIGGAIGAVFSLLVLLAGCSNPTDLQGTGIMNGAIRTDASQYEAAPRSASGTPAGYTFTVIAQFRNPTNTTITFPRCYPTTTHPTFFLVSTDSSANAYTGASACVGDSEPITVAPGAGRTDTLTFIGPAITDSTGKAYGKFTGTFQLVYLSTAANYADNPRSNPFTVSKATTN